MENGKSRQQRRSEKRTCKKNTKKTERTRKGVQRNPNRSVRQAPVGRPLNKVELRVLDSHLAMGLTARRGNIPILRDYFRKGTQNPVLRLKCALVAVSSTVGGVIDTVIPISLNQVFRYTSWDDVWDEFRIVRAEFFYQPHSVYYPTGTSRTITSCIDYDDATAHTSKNGCFALDTGRAWSTNEIINWGPVQPDSFPDEQWYNTQTDQATAVAYCKLYADGCSVSLAYGEAFGWLDVQFRATG